MRQNNNAYKYLFIIALGSLLAVISLTPSIGGPGDTDDPVITLSYLQMAGKYGEVPLRKNDEYPLDKGTTFILFDGDAEIRGVGDYYLIDLTDGKSHKRGKGLDHNHLYLITGGSDINIVARGDAKLFIKGGDGGPLRNAY